MKKQTTIYGQVSQILRENQHHQWAYKLENLVEKLNSNTLETSQEAAREIQGLCHIRSLGDLKITTVSGWEWNKKLEKLKKTVRRASRQLKTSHPENQI